jgi:hypothetical protein
LSSLDCPLLIVLSWLSSLEQKRGPSRKDKGEDNQERTKERTMKRGQKRGQSRENKRRDN